MICLQKILLCCAPWASMSLTECVHAHTLPASPSSLTGSYFCKAAFCFVSCFAAFAHTRLSLLPSLPLMGKELFPHLELLYFSSHSTIFIMMGTALRTLCLLLWKDRFPVYYCLFLIIHNHVPCLFFSPQKFPLLQPLSYRHLQALYWFVLPALPAQSPCCQVSGSVYFLQLFSPHRKVKAGIPGRPLLSGKNGLPLRPEV